MKLKNNTALLPFWMAGDPSIEVSFQILKQFIELGACALEIGVPYSDPVADGPLVQGAHERGLLNKIHLDEVFKLVRDLREVDSEIPIILFGYFNPIYTFGLEKYVRMAKGAGVTATLCVDLPLEEAEPFIGIHRAFELGTGFLITPSTDLERRKKLISGSSDFVYFVARAGVTGGQTQIDEALLTKIREIKGQLSGQKLLVGFGVSDSTQVQLLKKVADAAVVGSAFIRKFQDIYLSEKDKKLAVGQLKEYFLSLSQ